MKTMSSAKPTPAPPAPPIPQPSNPEKSVPAPSWPPERWFRVSWDSAKPGCWRPPSGLGSTVNDTFINANNLPNLIFLLVAGGVFNAVLVPQIIKASKAPDKGADYISRLLTLAVWCCWPSRWW